MSTVLSASPFTLEFAFHALFASAETGMADPSKTGGTSADIFPTKEKTTNDASLKFTPPPDSASESLILVPRHAAAGPPPYEDVVVRKDSSKSFLHLDGMDALLTSMGKPGRYQVLIFLALASCMFPVVFNDLCTIFNTLPPERSTCCVPSTAWNSSSHGSSHLSSLTPPASVCNASVAMSAVVYGGNSTCDLLDGLALHSPEAHQLCESTMEHHFHDPATTSIISEWNLVCGRYWLVSFATTIYFLGVMTGSMFFGHLADRVGRLPCIMACYVGYLPFGIALAYVQHYWIFLVLRFFVGFFIQGIQSVCFVLLMEFCSPRFREIVGGLEGLIGGLAVGALSGVSYWWQDWRAIQLCLTLPSILALSKYCFLRESLRWQMVQGKVAEAKKTIEFIFRWNKLAADPSLDDKLQDMSDALVAEQQLEADYTWLDCFRSPRMRKYTLAQSFMWFTVLFVTYGISFSINELSGNLYLNLIIGSAAEIPVHILTVYFMHRFGRKKPLLAFYGSCGLMCIIAAGMSGNIDLETPRTAIIFTARFCLAGSYAVVFVYGSELFPTVLRNTAFGICIFCHTSGGVIAPQVILLGKVIHESVPFVIFGSCCLLSYILVLSQPETLHKKMPDTIDEVEGRNT
ncbi:Organic cation transporter protein [Hypsibius exemplaris]|uniref:Organic cation transporter protein n=1 Tax=Hypsibius exemplaris TaxID=2072580 RepID=A0A1W0W8I8_HYPEX|nr:Organic cation transporter protein [Hypsibius exemplaris]